MDSTPGCQLVLWDLGRDQEVDRYEQQGVWGLAVDWSAMKAGTGVATFAE